MAKELFKEGATVEVSLEDEGFRGSWYTATVLRPHTKKNNNNHLYLEFHTLTSDDKATKRLREFVDVVLVRPVPPRESYRTFRFDEEVDAFHNDGWWEGIITSVVVLGDDSTTYSVFFRSSREQLEFRGSELRLHREWIYGEWCPPLEQ